MISSVSGKVLKKGADRVVISVGGLGIEVRVPLGTLERIPAQGEHVSLHTYMHVRDDAIQLFGFSSERDRELFVSLLSVSGFGAAKALAVLSVYSSERFEEIIRNQDADALRRIPGLGNKGAMRLIVEMKDKVGAPASITSAVSPEVRKAFDEAFEALLQLGYNSAEAKRALENYIAGEGELKPTAGELVQFALRNIGPRI